MNNNKRHELTRVANYFQLTVMKDYKSFNMTKNIVVSIFVIVLYCTFIDSNEYYDIIQRSKVCKILDKSYVANLTCRIKRISRTISLDSFEIIFHEGVEFYNFHHEGVLNKKFATIYRNFMIRTDDDACEIINGTNNNLVYNLFKSNIAKYGNMLEPCPISGRRYFKDWPIDYSKLPEIIPSGEFRLDILAYTKSENKTRIPLYSLNVFFEVKTKTALQWK